ncbi:MAG TPA: SDR family oxidoreductase [Verrucomicrobiales bacterium]|nr:SDR family oxidoreductase [Verrucomicrobiales bacterium]
MFRLDNKNALITGSGSGIGAAIAEVFAMAGAKVYVSDINPEAGMAIREQLVRSGHSAEFLQLDVADPESCRTASEKVLDSDGKLDILVNNAGIGAVGNMEQTQTEDLDRMFNVNVKGMYHVIRFFFESMKDRKKGSIINMASIGGIVGVRDRFAYCISKFAVVGLTKSMALDYAESGIRVNCICPGRVETPWVKKRLSEYPDPEEAYRQMASTQAMKRMGRPVEIAHAALYLACDESSFMTGETMVIDGGWNAGK